LQRRKETCLRLNFEESWCKRSFKEY